VNDKRIVGSSSRDGEGESSNDGRDKQHKLTTADHKAPPRKIWVGLREKLSPSEL
jgi:hypothetical protein